MMISEQESGWALPRTKQALQRLAVFLGQTSSHSQIIMLEMKVRHVESCCEKRSACCGDGALQRSAHYGACAFLLCL
jgi:hypothetical protein